jgi:hypothetical protein
MLVGGSDITRGTGRRKAAAEIVRAPGRPAGVMPGELEMGGGCGRGRCELTELALDTNSGGVRNGVVLALDNEGEDAGGSAVLGGKARIDGEEGFEVAG